MSDLPSAPGVVSRISSAFSRSLYFLRRQQHDWKVTVVRTSLERLAYQMVFPYLSIYIVALGATATQLGLLNSLGMIIAGIVAPFSGWIIDKTGPRKMYLFGIGLLAVCYLTYALAQNWLITILAMGSYWLGFSISMHSCATVCGNCLANKDRATGMMICETVAAGLLGMLGPILGSWLVTMNGGATISGIRPLFFICLGITIVTFIVVLVQLSNTRWAAANPAQPHFLRDFQQVMKEGRHLKKWLLIAAVGQFPAAMVFPFSQLYAYEVRHATPFILGAMVTGAALTSIIFAVPLGRIADRIGRKRVLYITIPLFWISNLLLVWSPAPAFLILAGILQGFYYLGTPISAAMERELIPPHQMGRWLGLARFFRMPLAAGMAFISGIIWDRVGPQYVFLIFILLDLVVRLPLLFKMPETLSLRLRTSGLS
jgi:MFS family permease